MTLIACCSVKGSPGVTTSVQALAEVWTAGRHLLVAELDPAGGDLAARLEVAPEPGLMTLAAAGRRELNAALVLEHAVDVSGDVSVLLAPPSARQVRRALDLLGDRLAQALADIEDSDVVIDCGRLDAAFPAPPWAKAAAQLVVVMRPTTAGVAHAVSRVPELIEDGCNVGLLLVGEPSPGRTHLYPAAEVAATLDVPVIGVVADDDRAAAVLDGRRRGEKLLRRSELLRSARDVTATIIGGSTPRAPELDATPTAATVPATLAAQVVR